MNGSPDDLYHLLPTIYLEQDAARGFPLKALFATLQDPYDLLRDDIAALYADWFVETCEPWILPYIGQLVAAGRLGGRDHLGIDTRSLVANTLAYRRRKGAPEVLEAALAQASGWPTRLVEPRPLIAVTAAAGRTPSSRRVNVDVRDARAIANLGGAFDAASRTVAVSEGEMAGVGRLGVWQWRLQSYPLCRVQAGRVDGHVDRRTFHPFGLDGPLFNQPVSRLSPTARVGPRNVPAALRRNIAALDLKDAVAAGGGALSPDNLFGGVPAFQIYLGSSEAPVAVEAMVIADLSSWRPPVEPGAGSSGGAKAAIDPERGRLLLLDRGDGSGEVYTDHSYGFAGDIGAGPYPRAAAPTAKDRHDRLAWLGDAWTPPPAAAGSTPPASNLFLANALEGWSSQGLDGIVTIPDSSTFMGPATIRLGGDFARNLAVSARSGERPCLIGDLTIECGADGGTLILDGLMVKGALRISGNLTLIVRHCTVMPPPGHAAVQAISGIEAPRDMRVVVDSSLVGALHLPAQGVRLTVRDSIVDGRGHEAIRCVGPADEGPVGVIESATIQGAARFRQLEASDSLFLGEVAVTDPGVGFVRHSFIPPGLPAARVFACVLASTAGGEGRSPEAPRFLSTRFGHPGYFYLAADTPRAIITGASDGQAMGAFHALGEAARNESFEDAWTEYAPYGLNFIRRYAS